MLLVTGIVEDGVDQVQLDERIKDFQFAIKELVPTVTGFWKTNQNVTLAIGLFHFNSYTNTLPSLA